VRQGHEIKSRRNEKKEEREGGSVRQHGPNFGCVPQEEEQDRFWRRINPASVEAANGTSKLDGIEVMSPATLRKY
jgi:hypothetical protein